MTSGLLLYLAAATAGQAAFALCYALLLARLSTFGWNRAYLLGALVASTLLPLVALPAAWARLLGPATAAPGLPVWQLVAVASATGASAATPAAGVPWLTVILAVYWLGVVWQAGRTARRLGWLYRLARRHPRTRLGRGWLVQLPAPGRPAFSFGRAVFLSPAHARLSAAEYVQLLQHEQVHGNQHHSLDLLLAEAIGWFFWFNGLVPYLRRQLQMVHEYLADAAVTRRPGSRRAYGHLLLKLAAGPRPGPLVHPFATRQVALRLHMLTNPPSSPMKKLRFLIVMPVTALAWAGAAALSPAPAGAAALPAATTAASAPGRVGTITWRGNTFLTTAQLNQALGLKPGDAYDAKTLASKLNMSPDGSDITSRYMDNGYLFFNLTPVIKPQPDGTTDLTFNILEGPTARISTVTVRGNQRVPTAAVLKLVSLRNGDLFSRAKLVAAQRQLAESGLFVPTKIDINPQPDPTKGLVAIEFVVVEK